MAAPWGAIIQATASHINTGLNMWQNYRAQKRAFEEAQRVRDWQTQEREAQNEWNLQQWNRENEYNDPSAQYERFSKLGFSPLAFLGQQGDMTPSAHMTSASAPMGAQAQILNPPLADIAGNAGELFTQWQAQQLERKRIQNETNKTDADVQNMKYQQMWQGIMNGKRFEFMGQQIELEKSKRGLTEQQAKATAQGILNAQNEIRQMQLYMAEMHAQMKRWDVQNACDQVHADNAVRELANRIWLNLKVGYNIRQDTINKYQEGENLRYLGYGQYWQGLEAKRSHEYNKRWEMKSDFNINVVNGMKVVSSVIEPLVQVSRIGMMSAITRVQNQNFKMMLQGSESTRNPIGFTY